MIELDVDPLPPNYIPLRVVALVECLTPDGERSLVMRSTAENMVWDNIGILETALDQEHAAAIGMWEPEGG